MANISGTNIGAPLAQFTTDDKFGTHYADRGVGGKFEVANVAARDAIFTERRTIGMFVTTQNDGKTYQLIGGIANSNWQELEAGKEGPQGPAGIAATITSATANTLPAGSSASVTMGGTAQARTFVFGIPEGNPGVKGDDGVSASITSVSATTLPAGSNPTVTAGGTPQARTFNFGIPTGATGAKGDKGDKGDKGEDGTSVSILGSYDTLELLQLNHSVGFSGDAYLVEGNLYVWSDTLQDWNNVGEIQGPAGVAASITSVSANTLPAGSNATVTAGGTAQARTFTFGIPTGPKGDSGNRPVANISERDAIPAGERTVGMFATVQNTGLTYQLLGGTENSNWQIFTSGGNLRHVETLPPTNEALPGVFYATSTGQPAVPGPQGPIGLTPDIRIGTVATVASTLEAKVTRRPDSPDETPIFDFEIPRGPQGAPGQGGGGGAPTDFIFVTSIDQLVDALSDPLSVREFAYFKLVGEISSPYAYEDEVHLHGNNVTIDGYGARISGFFNIHVHGSNFFIRGVDKSGSINLESDSQWCRIADCNVMYASLDVHGSGHFVVNNIVNVDINLHTDSYESIVIGNVVGNVINNNGEGHVIENNIQQGA